MGYKKRNTPVWTDTIPMRMKRLPNPTAQWGSLPNHGLPTPKALIAAQIHIKASLGPSFAYDLEYEVVSYRLILVYSDYFVEKFEVKGSEIPSYIREKIYHMSGGDRIIVEHIFAKKSGSEI